MYAFPFLTTDSFSRLSIGMVDLSVCLWRNRACIRRNRRRINKGFGSVYRSDSATKYWKGSIHVSNTNTCYPAIQRD